MEARYFYVPDAARAAELPADEARHAARVLRLQAGDEVFLMDGAGTFCRARLTLVSQKHCLYDILETLPQRKAWQGELHLAIAPTKSADRMEWLAEKLTEVGFDRLTFLSCRFSERRSLRQGRVEKIIVAAAKQSRKPFMPVVEGMRPFSEFVGEPREGRKYICHCCEEMERTDLFSALNGVPLEESVTILVGPEGDFSADEVRQAMACGYEPVTLGDSRLRTETAGLVAITVAQLAKKRHISRNAK